MQLQTARPESMKARLKQMARTPGRLDPRLDAIALPEIEFPSRTPDKRVNRLVRIAVAEATENHAPRVGPAVAIGVLKKQQLGVLAHVDPAVAQFQAGGHVQSLGEHGRFVGPAVMVGIFQDNDLIVGQVTGKDMRIGRCDGDKHPSRRVPPKRQGGRETVFFGGEEIDPQTLRSLERRQLLADVGMFVPMQHLGCGAVRPWIRLPAGNPPDALLRFGNERNEPSPLFLERNVVFAGPGELPFRVVAIEQFPVGRPPVVIPEPMLFDHRQAKRFEFGFRRRRDAEFTGHFIRHAPLRLCFEPHAVGTGQADSGLSEEIDKDQVALGRNSSDRLHVQGEVGVVLGDVRNEWTGRFFERHGRNEHDVFRPLLPGVDQALIRLGKGCQILPPGHRFKTAELRNHHRCIEPFELIVQRSKTVLAPALDRRAQGEYRVGFPGQVAEGRLRIGKGVGQDRLKIAGPLQGDHAGAAGEHHDIVGRKREGLLCRSARRGQSNGGDGEKTRAL